MKPQMKPPKKAQVWTLEAIRALGVRTDGVTACKIAYGVGRTKAYELLRSPEDIGFTVIQVPGTKRNRYVVPVNELVRLLGLEETP